MALSDLAVFGEYVYETMTEVIDQKLEGLIEATDGAIAVSNESSAGDFSESAFFGLISGGLVRRRDAYANGAVGEKDLNMKTDVEVKVASGTAPIRIDPGMFQWIMQDPKLAGATVGRQMAPEMLADLINTGLGITKVALSTETDVYRDITAELTDNTIDFAQLTKTAGMFGDRSSDIQVWAMHSSALTGIYLGNLQNHERLFSFSSLNVIRDPFGRLLIQTDSPQLVDVSGSDENYTVLGLTKGAVRIKRNADFLANEETKNGFENIVRTYQAQWSNNYAVKGFAWDKTTGGKSPNDAALFTAANWNREMTSHKDLAGVMLLGRAAG